MQCRDCEYCQKPFMPKQGRQKYCNKFCRSKAANKAKEPGELRQCRICGRAFEAKTFNHVYCSARCGQSNNCLTDHDVTTSTRGAATELAIAAELLDSGYSCFRSLSPHAFCDLIAVRDNDVRFIEARTGAINANGHIAFSLKRHPMVTEFAVRIPATGKIYFFPVSLFPPGITKANQNAPGTPLEADERFSRCQS